MDELTTLTAEEQRLIELFRQMEPPEQKLCTDLVEQMACGALESLSGGVVNYGKIINIGRTATTNVY